MLDLKNAFPFLFEDVSVRGLFGCFCLQFTVFLAVCLLACASAFGVLPFSLPPFFFCPVFFSEGPAVGGGDCCGLLGAGFVLVFHQPRKADAAGLQYLLCKHLVLGQPSLPPFSCLFLFFHLVCRTRASTFSKTFFIIVRIPWNLVTWGLFTCAMSFVCSFFSVHPSLSVSLCLYPFFIFSSACSALGSVQRKISHLLGDDSCMSPFPCWGRCCPGSLLVNVMFEQGMLLLATMWLTTTNLIL